MYQNLKNNIWCGSHIYFDDECREVKMSPYIDPYIRNTGIGSVNLWCGKHTYFDDQGKEIQKETYIDPYIRNTGIGSINLWCGKHTYFSNNQDIQSLDSCIDNTDDLDCEKKDYFKEEDYEIIYKTREIFDIDNNEEITEIYPEKIYNLE